MSLTRKISASSPFSLSFTTVFLFWKHSGLIISSSRNFSDAGSSEHNDFMKTILLSETDVRILKKLFSRAKDILVFSESPWATESENDIRLFAFALVLFYDKRKIVKF